MPHERLPFLLRCSGRHCDQLVPIPLAAMAAPETMRLALEQADRAAGGWHLETFSLRQSLAGMGAEALAALCPACYLRASRGVLSAVTHPIVHG